MPCLVIWDFIKGMKITHMKYPGRWSWTERLYSNMQILTIYQKCSCFWAIAHGIFQSILLLT